MIYEQESENEKKIINICLYESFPSFLNNFALILKHFVFFFIYALYI
jgi:hypothetical protein